MADPNLRDYDLLPKTREAIHGLKRLIWQGKFNRLPRFLNYLFDFLFIPLTDTKRRKAMQDKYEKEEDAHAQQEGAYSNTLSMAEKIMERMETLERMVVQQNKTIEEQAIKIAELTQENQYQKSEIKELKADRERIKEKYKKQRDENSILKIMATKGDSVSEDEKSGSISLKIKAKCKVNAELKFNEEDNLSSPKANAYGGFWDTLFYNYQCRVVPRHEEFLKSAAAKGNVEQVRKIIDDRKTDINGRGLPDSLCAILSGYYDKTPLMLACENGHVETVRLLLRSGCNVFLKDRSGFTAMDYAVKNDYPRICTLLKLKGAQDQETSPPLSPIMSPRIQKTEPMEPASSPSFTNGAW
jgi:hypothetical protein